MNRALRILPLGVLSLVFISCDVSLPVPLHPQETSMWCWAASGQMVMEHVDASSTPAQCVQANNRFGLSTCCSGGNPPTNCVKGGWPEFSRYGFSSQHTSSAALSWADLRAELLISRPVAFSWKWTDGGGHMMVAIGYQDADASAGTEDMVEVNNPWPPNEGDHYLITYDAYVQGSYYTHWDDYHHVQID